MNPKFLAGLLTVAVLGYLILMTGQAFAFMSTGNLILVILGAAILVLPLLGVWVVRKEWQFGRQVQALADYLAMRGELPLDDLPKRLSGRPALAAADERFTLRVDEVDAAPNDPGAWFRLAVAYDDAGDRKRGRSAMRKAVALFGAAHRSSASIVTSGGLSGPLRRAR